MTKFSLLGLALADLPTVFPRNRPSLNIPMGEIEPPSSSRLYISGSERLGSFQRVALPATDKTPPQIQLISGSSLLKWLNSLYRPAWPEGIRGKGVLPHSGGAIGASPSGKAVDFDSTIRRFESSRPSQAVTQLEIVAL
jgi:hypothetical protein